MIKPDRITPTTVRQLLAQWDNVPNLGRHPLARLSMVAKRCQQSSHPESDVGYGLALKELLHEAILHLKPNEGGPLPSERDWRPYLAVHQRYCHGRIPEWIMMELSISSRTFYRELGYGVQQIVAQFKHWELETEQPRVAPLTTEPVCPAPLLPHLPPHQLINRNGIMLTVCDWFKAVDGQNLSLYGLPGVGKTTTALMMVHHTAVRQQFPDGILWISVGIQPNIRALLSQMAHQVGVPASQITNAKENKQLQQFIAKQVQGQRWLFAFDDVWDTAVAFQLAVGGPNTVHLLTTRQPNVALQFSGIYALAISEFAPAQSEQLLAQLAPHLSQEQAANIHQLTGGLPLALMIIGKQLLIEGQGGQHQRLRQALKRLQNPIYRVNLSIYHAWRSSAAEPLSRTAVSLADVIGISTAALADSAQQTLNALTLFPAKPNHFSIEAGLAVSRSVEADFYLLIDHGLVEPVGNDRYSLHQAVHDVAQKLGNPKANIANYLSFYAALCEVQENGRFASIEQEQFNIHHAFQFLSDNSENINHLTKILLAYGRFLIDRGRAAEAQQLVQKVSSAQNLPQAGQVTLHIVQGRLAQAQNETQSALSYFQAAYELAEQIGLATEALQSKVLAMKMHIRLGNHNSAHQIALTIYAQIEAHPDLEWRGSAHLALSAISYYLSDIEAAFHHAHQARHALEQLPNKARLAGVFQNLGAFSVELGRFSDAFVYYDIALDKNRQANHKFREAQILINLGVARLDIGQWRQSHTHYEVAKQIADDIENNDLREQIFLNQAVVYLAQLDLSAARRSLNLGDQLVTNSHYLFRRVNFFLSFAMLHRLENETQAACEYAQQAFNLAQEIGHQKLVGEAAFHLGLAHGQDKLYQQAVNDLNTAVHMYQTSNQSHNLAEVYAYLAWYYHKLGQPQQARHYCETAVVALSQTVDGLHHAANSLLICHQLLQRYHHPAADAMWDKAQAYIQQQASQLDSPHRQNQFKAWYQSLVLKLSS